MTTPIDPTGWLPNLLGPLDVQVEGVKVVIPRRTTWNIIGATVADDPVNKRTDVTFVGGEGSGGGIVGSYVATVLNLGTVGEGIALEDEDHENGVYIRSIGATSPLSVSVHASGSLVLALSEVVSADKGGTGITGSSNDRQVLRGSSGGWQASTLISPAELPGISGLALCRDAVTGDWTTLNPPNARLSGSAAAGLCIDGTFKAYVDATTFYIGTAAWRNYSCASSNAYISEGGCARIATTGGTPQTVYSFTVQAGITEVVADVQAIKDDYSISGVWSHRCRVKRVSNTVTLGTERVNDDDADGMSSCVVSIDNSGTTGRIRFQGLSATNIAVGLTYQLMNKSV